MSSAIVVLSSKMVLTSEPYQSPTSGEDELIGRSQERRMVLAAWMAQPSLPPLAPLLIGEPGMGKNRLIYELARCTGKPLYVLQGHEDVNQ
jgi:MoxR-like ATPase